MIEGENGGKGCEGRGKGGEGGAKRRPTTATATFERTGGVMMKLVEYEKEIQEEKERAAKVKERKREQERATKLELILQRGFTNC